MQNDWRVSALIFHHVSPIIDYYTNTTVEIFAKQIELLALNYSFWTAEEAYHAFRSGDDPKGRVVLTFDDGYEDNFIYARPILKDFNIKATFYILPAYCGRQNNWNSKCNYRTYHMSWQQVEKLAAEGHEIGSHGLTHKDMSSMELNAAEHELAESKALIETELGISIKSFSYPYGLNNTALCGVAARYYGVAFSTVKSNLTNWYEGTYSLRRAYLPTNSNPTELLNIVNGKVFL